jgi:hypothetical protein
MDVEKYSIIADSSNLMYEFDSIGLKGVIKKIVLFRKITTLNENFYNLSFGDWDEAKGRPDDDVISITTTPKKYYLRLRLQLCNL